MLYYSTTRPWVNVQRADYIRKKRGVFVYTSQAPPSEVLGCLLYSLPWRSGGS